MSICRSIKIKCPNCGNKTEVALYDSINASLNPEWREALIQGNIHILDCPICQKTIRIDKSILYHDMENEFMVWYYPFDSIKDPGFFKKFSADGHLDIFGGHEDSEMAQYTKDAHYVFSMDEMVRYILFREKLAEIKNIPIKVEYAE